jgi:long-subunit acyl-CoA synthetase (AMP-forming)
MATLSSELRRFERPCGVVLEHTTWDSESGLLTTTLKLKRAALEAKYG